MSFGRVTFIVAIIALATILLAPAAYSFDRVPTMTLSELDTGMRGIGKTVIKGTKIEDFNFEIVGILEKGGFNGGALILARVWGPIIDKSGGIAGGYSGSPMYVNGKLIGALSAGWPFSDGDIAGVTPIHEMIKTLNYPGGGGFNMSDQINLSNESKLDVPLVHEGKQFDKVLLLGNDRGFDKSSVSENTMVMVATKTPLVVGGVSDDIFPMVKTSLESKLPFFDVMQGPGSGPVPNNFDGPAPEPGAAIGVQLMSGDIDLTAIGTLTYVDEYNRVLAFGHPFLQVGYIECPLVTAEIAYTLPSLQRSFKMGTALETIGSVEQDRSTCVAGVLGKKPDMLDIHVSVYDEDLDWLEKYDCSVIRHEETMSYYWALAPLEGIAQTLDRAGGGLMEVSFSLELEGYDEPLAMENVFHGDGVFGQYMAISEAAMLMSALTIQNVYKDVRINSINIEVTAKESNETLTIVKARSIMPEGMEEDEDYGEELDEGEMGDDFEGEEDMEEATVLLIGGRQGAQFIPKNVPDRAILNLYSTPFGREMIRLNAGEEVINAVEDYIDSVEEEEDEYYEVPQYYPGETIEAIVTLRPYRQPAFEQYIALEIPEDYPSGVYDVTISGGSGYFGGFFDPYFMGMDYYGGFTMPETLDEAIEDMMDRKPNDTLVMSLAPMYSDDPYAYLMEEEEEMEPIEAVVNMPNVVSGYFYLPIEILGDDYNDYDDTYEDDIYTDEEIFADLEAMIPEDPIE